MNFVFNLKFLRKLKSSKTLSSRDRFPYHLNLEVPQSTHSGPAFKDCHDLDPEYVSSWCGHGFESH